MDDYSFNDLNYHCWNARVDELQEMKTDIEAKIDAAISGRNQFQKPEPDPLLGGEAKEAERE